MFIYNLDISGAEAIMHDQDSIRLQATLEHYGNKIIGNAYDDNNKKDEFVVQGIFSITHDIIPIKREFRTLDLLLQNAFGTTSYYLTAQKTRESTQYLGTYRGQLAAISSNDVHNILDSSGHNYNLGNDKLLFELLKKETDDIKKWVTLHLAIHSDEGDDDDDGERVTPPPVLPTAELFI